MYQVLSLKYRPKVLSELLIQDHVRETLIQAIKENKIANSYLFAGPRGVGKTTTARILAKSLNCINGPTTNPCNQCSSCNEIATSRSLDVLEIDGASNRGIEQVRELRENIKYSPTSGKYKIYIIDEVHMLTTEAFNALLKTLEEPPKHGRFILATTAPHKVLPTILSRCQRFDFRKATVEEIKDRLLWIAEKEKIKVDSDALYAIARKADGSLRDGEAILDQLSTYKPEGIKLEDVYELLKLVPQKLFFEYSDLLIKNDLSGLIGFFDSIFEAGYDFIEFYSGVVDFFRTVLLVKLNLPPKTLALLKEDYDRYSAQAEKFTKEEILEILKSLTSSEDEIKKSFAPRTRLEILSFQLLSGNPSNSEFGRKKITNSGNLVSRYSGMVNRECRMRNEELFKILIERIRQEKPSLASSLELAKVKEFLDNTLVIGFPNSHSFNRERFEEEKKMAEKELSEILRCEARIDSFVYEEEDLIKKIFD